MIERAPVTSVLNCKCRVKGVRNSVACVSADRHEAAEDPPVGESRSQWNRGMLRKHSVDKSGRLRGSGRSGNSSVGQNIRHAAQHEFRDANCAPTGRHTVQAHTARVMML